jgi:hypothetical protein
METWQLIVLAAGGAAFLWPRRDALTGLLSKLGLDKTDATPIKTDANAVAAAYWLISQYVTAETAKQVRAEVADKFLSIEEAKPWGYSSPTGSF